MVPGEKRTFEGALSSANKVSTEEQKQVRACDAGAAPPSLYEVAGTSPCRRTQVSPLLPPPHGALRSLWAHQGQPGFLLDPRDQQTRYKQSRPALTAAGRGSGRSSRPAGSGTGRSRLPPHWKPQEPSTPLWWTSPFPMRVRPGSRETGTTNRHACSTTNSPGPSSFRHLSCTDTTWL